METEPMILDLNDNYAPEVLTVPRKVPFGRREEEVKGKQER